ncbi:MAG: DUF1659 domain-containing protein [Tissierellia bacterium]|jgi:hypothetical protein|nr:DUF1659 domain-containing protein [Bacillota bacterium]NLK58477.1 DUF1659 domain-containing protein [Tissierellia bacterium]
MIREEVNQVRLKVNLDGGLDGDKQIVKSKTYSRIHADANTQGLYDTGSAIADMQQWPLLSVVQLKDVVLVDDEA